ncbi:solute carrier family 25 member 38 [Syncephalastrum racemosum]|uniref:Mitochondrial glycine transporter n=1 Tax=Syncephalastrum racemosum TaxID=13706 RepID=A0A1X2H7Y8_SYNRA|nr:solute carrier family 25 member 38 [Syncephalastrum racemosum]
MSAQRTQPTTHMAGGAVSGMTACVILQPLDLIKTRLQQTRHHHPKGHSTLLSTCRDIINTNGVGGLWRGTMPTILRNMPGTALYFTTLSEIRHVMDATRATWQPWLRRDTKAKDQAKWENLFAGVTARGSVGFIMMPVTVLKVRYESNFYNYRSMTEAFRSIVQYDGVRGLFAGYGATFIRDAPFAGIYLLCYEQCKSIINLYKSTHELAVANVVVNLTSGVVAGTAATAVTQPFDLMKTRMQIDPNTYRNTWHTARHIFGEAGWRGFFDGLSLRLARKPLSSAISWAIYEEFVRFATRQPLTGSQSL